MATINSGTLYTVATPIGNLGDMTFRAVEILKQVDVIACEDTRETLKLLQHYNIHTPLKSYHAQSSQQTEDSIVELLQAGKSVALVCDRGTPGISDPGSRLIERAVHDSIPVVPIPGACAVTASLQAAGVSTKSFVFLGFIPHKKGRQTFIQTVLEQTHTVVFYESPHRILKCLQQFIELGIGDRPLVVARELTKQYEEFLRGTAEHILHELQSRPSVQGEFVVIVDQKQ